MASKDLGGKENGEPHAGYVAMVARSQSANSPPSAAILPPLSKLLSCVRLLQDKTCDLTLGY